MTETALPLEFGGDRDRRPVWTAIGRGLAKRCPACGKGHLFSGYLQTAPECSHCGLDFSGHRADDGAPYATLFVVGKITIPGALFSEKYFDPPLWAQFAFWVPLILLVTFWFLPVSKGGIIGLQWANKMHGFDPDQPDGDDLPVEA